MVSAEESNPEIAPEVFDRLLGLSCCLLYIYVVGTAGEAAVERVFGCAESLGSVGIGR